MYQEWTRIPVHVPLVQVSSELVDRDSSYGGGGKKAGELWRSGKLKQQEWKHEDDELNEAEMSSMSMWEEGKEKQELAQAQLLPAS
ncbi:hypothetical protein CORC01_02434 [Colletotrichum orchidophilum]|uniref:Uncharacterized protein n=1 Tax=Colletotrichum orchidophilum TaxID=1209926 RepID=A0A1G4BL65_9PEZI|nr:uncharacterized protein CORC01_02434 [Colletotrichum orchidophilum]OHF02154.1 hypothetical protein CORC01_02434 [Colletotrichum orchidophilum]